MRIRLVASCAAVAIATGTVAGCSAKLASGSEANVRAAPGLVADNWSGFRDAFIEGWFKIDPANAVYQGRHDFDGQIGDWSADGLRRQSEFLRRTIADANKLTGLDARQTFERDYLIKVAEGKLFWLDDADQPHTNPAWYVNAGLDPNVYVARNYADAPTRMKALIELLKKIPVAAGQIRLNLDKPLPLSFVNYGVAAFDGFADYYSGGAKQAFAGVRDDDLQRQLNDAAREASASMRGLARWLGDRRAVATQDFALGPDKFSRMLSATEGVTIPLNELQAIGEADLKRNKAALDQACARYAPGQSVEACVGKMSADKPVDGPVAEARRQIPMLRDFVMSHDLVTIPGTEEAEVEESPPYNRQNSAYIDPPGPYEHGIPSIYYISPPDPAWDKATRDAFVPGKDDLLFTSVHEVMPGHFVQFLHANRSPSKIGRLFVGYAFAEGWAHYTEEMMWEAGLGAGNPEVHIGQLSNALLRDCRFLSAIGLHARGMTQDQSRQLFVRQCYQDEGNARQQSARGTYDPAYLNYTLGKLMIRKLRADWTATRGGRKAWKPFHDALLSFGGPPIPLVRQAMMNEAEPKAEF